MTTLLALYRVLKANGRSLPEIGELVQSIAQYQLERFPQFLRHLIGRLYMTRFWQKHTSKKAALSQARLFSADFVYEVVGEKKDKYGWGINYLECGVEKFFANQGAAEFTPYMCLIDYLIFPAMDIQLERTGTIANGCMHCDFRFSKKAL